MPSRPQPIIIPGRGGFGGRSTSQSTQIDLGGILRLVRMLQEPGELRDARETEAASLADVATGINPLLDITPPPVSTEELAPRGIAELTSMIRGGQAISQAPSGIAAPLPETSPQLETELSDLDFAVNRPGPEAGERVLSPELQARVNRARVSETGVAELAEFVKGGAGRGESPFTQPAIKDFTPESRAVFQKTKNPEDLIKISPIADKLFVKRDKDGKLLDSSFVNIRDDENVKEARAAGFRPNVSTGVTVNVGDKIKPAPSGERKQLTDLIALKERVEKVGELFDPSFVGPLDSLIGWANTEFLGFAGEQEVDFRRTVDDISDALLRARSGAQINEQEFKRMLKIVARLRNPDKTFVSKLNSFGREMDNLIEIKQEALAQSGFATIGDFHANALSKEIPEGFTNGGVDDDGNRILIGPDGEMFIGGE